MAKRLDFDKILNRTLKKRISTAAKTATGLKRSSDANYTVFQLSEATIRDQLLYKENKDLAPLVAESYKKYLKRVTTLVSSEKALKGLVDKKHPKPILYSPTGSVDIILITKNLRTLTSLLNKANAVVSKELNIAELQLRGPTEGYDIGRVGRSSKQHTATSHLINLQQRLANKAEASRLLQTVLATINKLDEAEVRAGEYTANFSTNSKAGRLAAKLDFTYVVPQSKTIQDALAKAEDEALKDLTESILNIKASKTINDQISEVIRSALWGKSSSYRDKDSDSGTIAALNKAKDDAKRKRAKVSRARQKKLDNQKPKSRTRTTVLGLRELINGKLAKAVEENMGRPNLIYRTGRFAESVQVTRITEGRDAALNIYYNYMKRPYETFEPHGALGHLGYNPVPLMNKSIRDVAMELTRQKFRSIRE